MGRDVESNMEGSMTRSTVSGRRPKARLFAYATAAGSLAATAALAAGSAGAAGPSAHAARSLNLKESGTLHLSNKHGIELKEQGTAKGTLSGPIYLQLRVNSTRSVSAQVQVYPSGGSLSGGASASYHVSGGFASFSGTLNINKGSGRYSKANGKGLSFSGTIRRSNDEVTVKVSGRLSY
jgi:hypothetical protein